MNDPGAERGPLQTPPSKRPASSSRSEHSPVDATETTPLCTGSTTQVTYGSADREPTSRKRRGDIGQNTSEDIDSGTPQYEEDKEMPEGPTVTRAETWAYYLYYNGDNGVGPNGYARLLFQSLATAAAVDMMTGKPCRGREAEVCRLTFAGKERSVASVALIADGISFGIMTLLFTTIGSAADYGDVSRYVLLLATVVCWATQFAFLSVSRADQWRAALGLYMIGFVSYGVTLVFYASIFPRLARNTPTTKEARRELEAGRMSAQEFATVEMLERNRLSSISTAHSNWGYLATLVLNLSILLPQATRNLPKINNYVLALTNSYWIVLGLPWFLVQRRRPGPPLPQEAHWLTIGWKQIAQALGQYKQLPYTFVYLFSFFLLADGLNTTGALVGIVQNAHTKFSFLQTTYLGMAQASTSILSCYLCWWVQQRFRISTKRMFQATNCVTVLIPFWGMLGLLSTRVGFHNTWEFWLYNIVFGLGQAPYYAYSQSMMADLTPPGFEGMWFGLFGITNRASSLIGPNVCAAIIDRTGNNWSPFVFLFAICLCAALTIALFVDMDKGHKDAVDFSIRKRGRQGDVVDTSASGGDGPLLLPRPIEPNEVIVG